MERALEIDRDELARRLGTLAVLDVRTVEEFTGEAGYPCDPRQGSIPSARNVPLSDLLECSPAEIREVIALPEGAEVVCYCHSGSRSAVAAQLLRAAGYEARNYAGSWHEWSREPDPGSQ
jgi:thiosulfate/3-mercaptopyruvate sulfurtransferase